MPRVLIAGCGYVGTATADLFHEAGWTVEGWTRSKESAAKLASKAYPVIAVDISRRDEVNARPENFDVVILCASTRGGDVDLYRQVYLQGARSLLDRFIGSTFLFTSSTSVYGQKDGAWVTEENAAQPDHEAGRVLRETEQIVLSGGGIVARLAGIYGPGRSALLTRFLRGRATIEPENDRFVNQAHRDDIATALFRMVDRESARSQIYNVVDNKPILRNECYRWLAERLKRPLPPVGESTSKPKRGKTNKRVSNAKLRALGWTPRYPSFAEGMEESVLPSFGF